MRALRLFWRRRGRRRTWLSLRGRGRFGLHSRRSGLRPAGGVTAHAEAAITLEAAIAIEDREPGELDVHNLTGCRRPRNHDAAEGVARRNRVGHAAFRIEVERGYNLTPRSADHLSSARAHRIREGRCRELEMLLSIHGPDEAQ